MAILDEVLQTLEIQPTGIPTVVRLSQNENGRQIRLTLRGQETAFPTGCLVTISGTKPDGVVYSAEGALDGNVAVISEDTQMTAVAGMWKARVQVTYGGSTIATELICFEVYADPVDPDSVPSESEITGLVAQAQYWAENAKSSAYGSPLTASTAAEMTETDRVYVYTGSESGYSNGHWYYYDGTAWQDGGVYMAGAVQTDTTLSVPGMPADAKATGDAIAAEADRVDTLLEGKADKNGNYHDMTAGTAEVVLSEVYDTDKVPYKFRRTPYKSRRLMDEIVGGSVVWNQIFLPQTRSNNGITLTAQVDNSAILNGTATAGAWLQMTSMGRPTVGHKYFLDKGADSDLYAMNNDNHGIATGAAKRYTIGEAQTDQYLYVNVGINITVDNLTIKPQFFDLTQMFGSTIADYIYTLEQSTAGAGVALFRSLFGASYYPYNAGELVSISGLSARKAVGKNLLDPSLTYVNGKYINADGTIGTLGAYQYCESYIPVFPDTAYVFSGDIAINSVYNAVAFYDSNKTFIERFMPSTTNLPAQFTTPSNCAYIRFNASSANWVDFATAEIQLEFGSTATAYEPYEEHTYSLDNSLTLRGITKLVDGKIKFDGDIYASDGTVTRRYGVVDLGTLTWVYDTNLQFFYARNTEVAPTVNDNTVANIVCAKYLTTYRNNITSSEVDKVICVNSRQYISVKDTAYTDAATFKSAMSGIYLVCELATPTTETAEPYQAIQTCDPDGTEEYVSTTVVPVGHESKYYRDLDTVIPAAPTADGVYTLKCTVSGGVPSYSWEV